MPTEAPCTSDRYAASDAQVAGYQGITIPLDGAAIPPVSVEIAERCNAFDDGGNLYWMQRTSARSRAFWAWAGAGHSCHNSRDR